MSVRRRAYEALIEITEKKAYANLALKAANTGLEPRDAAFVTKLVYTAIENLGMIDLAIAKSAKGKLDKPIRAVLRLGAAQALYMDTPASAACNESVKLVKEIGKAALSGFVNAVMRAIVKAGKPDAPDGILDRMELLYGCPKWLAKSFIERFGEEFALLLASAKPTPLTLRAQYPYTSDELQKELEARGASYSRGKLDSEAFLLTDGLNIASDELFTSGRVTVEGESAMLACRAVMIKKGMRVLDACAAPGGKTAYLASLSQNEAVLTAFELHPHRAELIKKTAERLKAENIEVICRDATVYDAEYEKAFDAVLLDAPCSGLGVTGKADIKLNKTFENIKELAAIQEKLLDTCANYVKPGGALVYSTCTVTDEENGAQIRRFLKEHSDFRADDSAYLSGELLERAKEGYGLQLFPNTDGCDGFFIARLERNNE